MATETVEMSSANTTGLPTHHRAWFVNRSNAFLALLFAAIGIAAAVGLGSGDWYVAEASTYIGSATVPGSYFKTAVFGLRLGYFCNGPAEPVPYGSNGANQGTGVEACYPYTYRDQWLAANWVKNGNSGANDDQKSAADDAMTAFTHLIGASGIITALLVLVIVIAAHQFFVNLFNAHGVSTPLGFSGRISLIVLIILEALVLIFWITIFPYKYFSDQEPNLVPAGTNHYDVYHTLGLGFSIQIAGLLVGLFGLFYFPKNVVVLKHNSV